MDWTYTGLWDLMVCVHECWRSWLVSLQDHSPLSVKGHSGWGKVPEDWKKTNVIHNLNKKGKKKDWKKYKLVCLAFILRKWMEQTVLETICKHIRKRKWFRIASFDLWRGNDAWLTWQPSMMKWLAWWMREEKLMLFIFTLPKLLTLLPITSSLANWWSTA